MPYPSRGRGRHKNHCRAHRDCFHSHGPINKCWEVRVEWTTTNWFFYQCKENTLYLELCKNNKIWHIKVMSNAKKIQDLKIWQILSFFVQPWI
jgi:hypothetical protein